MSLSKGGEDLSSGRVLANEYRSEKNSLFVGSSVWWTKATPVCSFCLLLFHALTPVTPTTSGIVGISFPNFVFVASPARSVHIWTRYRTMPPAFGQQCGNVEIPLEMKDHVNHKAGSFLGNNCLVEGNSKPYKEMNAAGRLGFWHAPGLIPDGGRRMKAFVIQFLSAGVHSLMGMQQVFSFFLRKKIGPSVCSTLSALSWLCSKTRHPPVTRGCLATFTVDMHVKFFSWNKYIQNTNQKDTGRQEPQSLHLLRHSFVVIIHSVVHCGVSSLRLMFDKILGKELTRWVGIARVCCGHKCKDSRPSLTPNHLTNLGWVAALAMPRKHPYSGRKSFFFFWCVSLVLSCNAIQN